MSVYVFNKENFEKYKSRTDLGIGNEVLSERILNMTGTELISDDEIIERFYQTRCIHHHNILTMPIKEYGGYEIVTCIHEKVLLEYAVPIMSRYLEVFPLTAGIYYKGEVLTKILDLDKGFWNRHRDWHFYFKELAIKSLEEHGVEFLKNELGDRVVRVFEKVLTEKYDASKTHS